MEFSNIEELIELFGAGTFTFPKEMTVAGILYKSNKSTSYNLEEMINKKYKAVWVYTTAYREQAIEAGLNQLILFLWSFDDRLRMLPYDVRASSKARYEAAAITEMEGNGDKISVRKEQILGDVTEVIITSIPGTKPIQAKIDTGADISSLHAEEWSINDSRVTFMAPDLSDNKITMPVLEKQAIKLSNGTMEYRPVIELNIKINEQQLSNCMFNLNDRGSMTYPILIGQNILEAGKFMIDPSIDAPVDSNVEIGEDLDNYIIDWEGIQEECKDTDRSISGTSKIKLQKIIDFLNDIEK